MAGTLVHLLAALIGFLIGYVCVRRRAVAQFRRRLRRQGVPGEIADDLAGRYKETFQLGDLFRGDRGRGRASAS